MLGPLSRIKRFSLVHVDPREEAIETVEVPCSNGGVKRRGGAWGHGGMGGMGGWKEKTVCPPPKERHSGWSGGIAQ